MEKLEGAKTDVFAWANNLVGDIEDYQMQLFLVSKNSVIYSLNNHKGTVDRLRALFVTGMMERVFTAAERGGQVRKYEDTVRNDGNIAWLQLDAVARAGQWLLWLEEHPTDIDRFQGSEHDLKRQVGIFAKFSMEGKPDFYIFKAFSGTAAPAHNQDFVLNGDGIELLRADAAFKIDPGEQVLIINTDIFVFNQGKFEALFNMHPHQLMVANRNGAVIDANFKLRMPLLIPEIAILAQKMPAAIKRLSQVDPDLMTQQQVDEAIDEFEVPLMHDDDGAIILEDGKDVIRFLDVISDSYLHSTTGNDYLAKTKKLLENED